MFRSVRLSASRAVGVAICEWRVRGPALRCCVWRRLFTARGTTLKPALPTSSSQPNPLPYRAPCEPQSRSLEKHSAQQHRFLPGLRAIATTSIRRPTSRTFVRNCLTTLPGHFTSQKEPFTENIAPTTRSMIVPHLEVT